MRFWMTVSLLFALACGDSDPETDAAVDANVTDGSAMDAAGEDASTEDAATEDAATEDAGEDASASDAGGSVVDPESLCGRAALLQDSCDERDAATIESDCERAIATLFPEPADRATFEEGYELCLECVAELDNACMLEGTECEEICAF